MVYNISVSDMTITGRRKSLTVSNTFKTSFKNMRFNWLPPLNGSGGIWLDGDDGRDFTMSYCEINCPYYFSSQFARSFAYIYIDHTKFNQAGIQFTEFNINANVTDCEFNLAYNGLPGEVQQPGILLGNTVSSINFTHNIINASKLNVVFYSGEIQGSKAAITSAGNISNNIIKCNNTGTVFSGSYSGAMNISNNNISGRTNFLFGVRSHMPSIFKALQNFNPSFYTCLITNNTFTGFIDGFGGAADGIHYIGNKIKRFGASKASNEFNVWGNILYTHFKADTTVTNFVCRNNTFENWNLLPNSFSHYWTVNERTDISNNRFIKAAKDTVVTLRAAVKH